MSKPAIKAAAAEEEEDKRDLPSFMTSYQIFARNISISQISPSQQGTTNPYVVIRLKGGQKYSMTKSQANTLDPQYDDILHLDGQSVGSDVLILYVYNQNGEQNPDKDECLGLQKLVISSLELGLVKNYDLKLYKTINGSTKKDYNSKIGAAGVLHIEMHIAKLGTLQFQSKPWPPRIFYTLWLHVDRCKNVPLAQKGVPVNPFIISKISPCLNHQKQTTPVCFNDQNPIWNILQCFHIDSFEKQIVYLSLMNYEEGSAPKKISSLKIPIHLAKPDGKPFTSQMLFNFPGHMTKGCVFIFKMQLLEPGNIPFDGMISMKHQKLKLNLSLYNLENLPATDPSKTVYCIVSCGKIYKKSKEVQNTNPAEINQDIIIHDITQSQLILINVIVDNHLYGQVPIHLNKYMLKTRTQAESFTLFNKATASVKFDLMLSPEEPEFEDKEEISDQIDEGIEIKVPPNINNYKNNYKKGATSANSSAVSSATNSPTKAPEASGNGLIKALLQQAKAGEMSKAVESTLNNGSYVANTKEITQSQERSQKINKVQQLASAINQSKNATTETKVTNTQTQSPSTNKANLAQKFLNSINSQKQESSSQETVIKRSATVQQQTHSNTVASSSSNNSTANLTNSQAELATGQSQKDTQKINQITQLFNQMKDSNQEGPTDVNQIKQIFNQIKDNTSNESNQEYQKIDQIKNSVAIVKDNNSEKVRSSSDNQINSISVQSFSSQTNSQENLIQPRSEPHLMHKHQSRRLSQIINSNHNLEPNKDDNVKTENTSSNADISEKSESNPSIPASEKPTRRRYSSIHSRPIDLNITEPTEKDEKETKVEQQIPIPTHRATIAQKYLNQINSNQQNKVQTRSIETTTSQSQTNTETVNRVKQLASQYGALANSQTQNDLKGSSVSKRRSTFNVKDQQQQQQQQQNNENLTRRRSSLTGISNIQLSELQEGQESNTNDSQQQQSAQESLASQEPQGQQVQQQQQQQQTPQSPRSDNRSNLAQKFLNQISANQSTISTQELLTPQKPQEQQPQAPLSPRSDNRSNLAQKFLNQISSNQSTTSTPSKSTTTQSDVSPSPQMNRVKQLASQINSVTSAQSSNETTQSPKTRRATEAIQNKSSIPSFDNLNKRRSSHEEVKLNSVKQLASQINNKIQGTDNNQSSSQINKSSSQIVNSSNQIVNSSNQIVNSSSQNVNSSNQISNSSTTKTENQSHITIKESSSSNKVITTKSSAAKQSSTTESNEVSNASNVSRNIDISNASNSSNVNNASNTIDISNVNKSNNVSSSSNAIASASTTKSTSSSSQTKSSTISSSNQSISQKSEIVSSSTSVISTSSTKIEQKAIDTSAEVKTREFLLDLDEHYHDGPCRFDWGSNDSLFSSSFTGYSECSRSLGTENSDSAEKYHAMKHVDDDPNYKIKPEWHQKVYGQFLSASNLPIKSGKIFATLQLRGLGGLKHFKFTTKEVDPNDLNFNTKINFDRVKKGDSIEIILYSKKDENDEQQIPIGSGAIACRNLKENADEVYNVKLEKPLRRMFPENVIDINNDDIKDFGEVQMSLNTNIEFTELE